MKAPLTEPFSTEEGIVFTVHVGDETRECYISNEALIKLAEAKMVDATDADPMDIFHAFEQTIKRAASRLVAAKVPGSPLVLQFDAFQTSSRFIPD